MEQIRLNLIPTGPMPTCHASQYDKKREIGLVLFNGTRPLLLTDETLELDVRKSDNHIVTIDVPTPEGTNLAVFETTEQMCAVAGSNECELRIKKAGSDIGSLNFIMEIERSPMENGLQSDSEIRNLATQIAEITTPIVEEIAPPIIRDFLDDLPKPMIYKGTLGTGGTIQTLPAADAEHEGYTYKVITEGTYAEQEAKIGDTFTCCKPEGASDFTWVLFSQGDTDSDTWRNIKVNGTEVIGSGISSGAVDFIGSENIEIEYESTGNKIKAKTKNLYTKEEVNDLIEEAVYDLLPSETESGPIASFETDLALPLKSLEIDVNAVQDLHGYDYPWIAGGGKNLLKTSGLSLIPPSNIAFSNATKRTFSFDSYCLGLSHNNYYQPNKITSYSISENSVVMNSSAQAYGIGVPMTLEVGVQYNLSFVTTGGRIATAFYGSDGTALSFIDNTTNNYSFTVPEDTAYVVFVFKVTTNDVEATFSNIQVEKGSTATDYAPYENICPIEGWSEVDFARTGKNLIDRSKFDTATANFCWGYRGEGFLLKGGKTYIFSTNQVMGSLRLVSVDEQTVYAQSSNGLTVTYTPSKDTLVVFRLWKSGGITATQFQLEVGSTATEYEPYVGNEYIINLGGTYYGGHFTQDKAGHRQFEVTSRIASYTGESGEAWSMFTVAQGNLFRIQASDRKDGYITESNCKCNSYRPITQAQRTNGTVSGTGLQLDFINNDFSSVEDWKTNLADNPIQIVYELATPFTIDLPDGEPITTLVGTNNIYADSGDTAVEFKESINQKIASLQALLLST